METKIDPVHPGVFIAEGLAKSGMTHLEFARRMKWSLATIQSVLTCSDDVRIDETTAKRLSSAIGTSPFVWIELQKKWDEEKPQPFTFDFDRLTKRQQEVLGMVAISQDGGHGKRTLESLERHGLIERRQERSSYGRSGAVLAITRWDMPIAVHIAWCDWCSRQEFDDE